MTITKKAWFDYPNVVCTVTVETKAYSGSVFKMTELMEDLEARAEAGMDNLSRAVIKVVDVTNIGRDTKVSLDKDLMIVIATTYIAVDNVAKNQQFIEKNLKMLGYGNK